MLKTLAAVLLTMSMIAGAANARGGGGAEPMPGVNFTEMPPYRPCLVKPAKHRHKHVWTYRCID